MTAVSYWGGGGGGARAVPSQTPQLREGESEREREEKREKESESPARVVGSCVVTIVARSAVCSVGFRTAVAGSLAARARNFADTCRLRTDNLSTVIDRRRRWGPLLRPHKDFSDLYEKMSGKGETASGEHRRRAFARRLHAAIHAGEFDSGPLLELGYGHFRRTGLFWPIGRAHMVLTLIATCWGGPFR